MNKEIILVTINSNLSNYRAKKIFELKSNFSKFIVFSKVGNTSPVNIITGSYPNVFGLLKKFGLYKIKTIFDKFFYFPSPDVLFINKAIKTLNALISNDYMKYIITIIIITPPHINALLGYKIKKKWPNVKLIIDWQDLWTFDEYHLKKTSILYWNKLKKVESKILNIANINIVTNEFAEKILITKYNINAKKVKYIYHPFDKRELYKLYDTRKYTNKYNFGYLGHLIKPPKVLGDKLLDALNYCYSSGIDLEMNIFGDEQKITKSIISKRGYQFVKLHNRVSHEESINNLINCDFLLLSLEDLPNTKIIMHGKLSHYLMINKPIIAFVPNDSFVANLIRKTNSGYVITSEKHWGEELYKIISKFNFNEYLTNRNEYEVEKFSWENISKQWVNVINGLS